jgi:YVTN family beta-propeller protein
MRYVHCALIVLAACSSSPDGQLVTMPNSGDGIGFDDLRWSSSLGRVMVPAGRAGALDLVDPDTKAVTEISAFSKTADFSGGHDDGPTSVDEGRGMLFVTDRTSQTLVVLDANSHAVLATVPLSTNPDYVRYVAPTDELWVSEPAGSQIEIFALAGGSTPKPSGAIPVGNGPESLVIDAARGRAYTHHWQSSTIGIDVRSRTVIGTWQNGCAASRGIEIEPEHGWVLAACNEGTLTVIAPDENGRIVSAIAAGSGYDVMGYARATRHAYLAGSACACLTVIGIANSGEMSVLGRFDAPSDTHCAVADDRGHAWVCSPSEGGVRRVDDGFPSWANR